MIPFTDLIRPHTGEVIRVRPAGEGHGWSTPALVSSERGEFFVKGVPNRPGGRLDSAQREATINPFVRNVTPTMRWQAEDEHWFVMGFDAIEGRPADFLPGSSDLGRVVEVLNRVSEIPLPAVARGWEETRWDRFATDDEKALLRGDSLTYTDVHELNFLLTEGGTWLLDWGWPTHGAPVIMPSDLAVQLVAARHSPESAEGWVGQLEAWKASSPESVIAFARANVGLYE
ncbi:protein kinase [Nocardiopsis sp. NPDC007018]|uniref:protein kinase n=1 Tax=Nocardiopsis sp. NPDC007018 TaxID=3155721 RepID=UPI0033FCC4BF